MTPAPPPFADGRDRPRGPLPAADVGTALRPGWRHVVALVVVVAGLFVCYGSVLREGADFAILLAVCGAMAVGVSGLGPHLGARLGAIVGLSIAIGLCTHSHAALTNQLLFATIAASASSLIGWLAGSRSSTADTSASPEHNARHDASRGLSRVATLALRFQRWVADGRITWRAFDQFVRTALRETCVATHVRCFHVQRGLFIRPLSHSLHAEPIELAEADRELLSALLATREPLVVSRCLSRSDDDPTRSAAVDAPARHLDCAEWLIPICDNNAVIGIVAIGTLNASISHDERSSLVEALARTLSLCWICVRVRRRLSTTRDIDRPSGAMTRERLLADCQRVCRAAAADGEPLSVVVLGIEGMRRLDDDGLWKQRDRLVDRLGRVIRRSLRADDLLGRFCDDRFVVVLRRVEATLGELIARKLLDAARATVANADLPAPVGGAGNATPRRAITIRAGAANFAVVSCDANDLIGAAMSSLDHARQQQRELVARRIGAARFVPISDIPCAVSGAELNAAVPHEA